MLTHESKCEFSCKTLNCLGDPKLLNGRVTVRGKDQKLVNLRLVFRQTGCEVTCPLGIPEMSCDVCLIMIKLQINTYNSFT